MRFEDVQNGYANLFAGMVLSDAQYRVAELAVERITKGETEYRQIEALTGVPWIWVGIVHHMETDPPCDFASHIHNGDPLTARTVRKPANRPVKGEPPFSWVPSAIDALELMGLTEPREWTIARMLYEFERYNGFGYFSKGVNSPYLWNMSSHAQKGRYVADGPDGWDAAAVSAQCGAAPMLLVMCDRHYCTAPLRSGPPPRPRTDPLPVLLADANPDGDQPAPTLAPASPVLMTVIDWVLGGAKLQGYKTLIGVTGYTILSVAQSTGLLSLTGIDPAIATTLQSIFAALAGLGLASKIERAKAT